MTDAHEPWRISRRAAIGVLGSVPLIPAVARAKGDADPFDLLRKRWTRMLTGGPDLPARAPYTNIVADVAANAAGYWETMADPASSPTALWSDPLSGEREYNSRITADRLRVMALAWATPGSALSASAKLEDALIASLRWFEATRYSILIERGGNWWEWEMGIPLALTDLVLLLHDPLKQRDPELYDRLTAAIDRFTPAPFVGTAANRVWRSHVVMLNAIAMRRADKLVAARDAIPTTLGDVVSGDGFHRDGSFVQHDDLAYTGGYGRDLLIRAALLIYLLDGSRWAFSRAQWQPLCDRVPTSFAPFMYRGAFMDAVRGRNLSRANLSDIASGQIVIAATLYLAAVANDPRLTALAKGWIARQHGFYDVFRYNPKLPAYWLTPHMAELVVRAMADGGIPPAPDPVGSFAFPEMDRFVHRRPGFAVAIPMNSSRIQNYESVNEENLTGWYQGSGMTTVYLPEAPNYADDFWPTVDPYRLPGVTLDKRPRAPSAKVARNTRPEVGALSLGDCGMAAMRVETDEGTFAARTAWFAAGDVVVALGSGIRSDSDAAVETILFNHIVRGDAGPLIADGRPIGDGAYRVERWLHVPGLGGILFAAPVTLHTLRETRTGAWWDINHQGASPRDPRTRRYLTGWIDHGVRPRAATYAYALLPGATQAQTLRSRDAFAVLANDAAHQAARVGTATGHIFWESGAHGTGFAPSAPALIMQQGEHLGIADPSQGEGRMTVAMPTQGIASDDRAVEIIEGELRIDSADLRGRTVRATYGA